MFRKYLFIFLCILALINVGFIAVRYFIHYQSVGAEEMQISEIQENVWRNMEVLDKESAIVANLIDTVSAPDFEDFQAKVKNPYFIFRDSVLIFWSDYRLVPDYASINGKYTIRAVNLKNGKYLVHKLTLNKGKHKFEVFSLVPLSQKHTVSNDYLQSGLNSAIIPYQQLQVTTDSTGHQHQHHVYTPEGDFLFSLLMPDYEGHQQNGLWHVLSVIGGVLAALILAWLLVLVVHRLNEHRHYELGFLLLALYLLALRTAMLEFKFPTAWMELDLFNSKYYASSDITPSLGDLLLNVVCVAILIAYILAFFYKSSTYRVLTNLSKSASVLVSILAVGISHWLLYLHFYVLRTIYLHSQLTLDITASIEFSFFKIICLVIFVINSWIFFISVHLLTMLFIRTNRGNEWQPIVWFSIATVLYALLSYALDIYYPAIIFINALYFLLIYWFRLPRFLHRYRYITSIYLFTAALVCATVGAYAVYHLEQRKNIINLQSFGAQLLAENDRLGEFLLNEAVNTIREDPFIKTRLIGPFVSSEAIEQKIKRVYLKNFDKYDVDVFVFDPMGNSLSSIDSKTDYWKYLENYSKSRYKTIYPNLYFVNEFGGNVIKRYISLIPIETGNNPVGYLVLDLKQKKVVPTNVYPELLVDKRFIQSPESRNYSYAIYKYGDLVYSEGNFNYQQSFNIKQLDSTLAYDPGIVINDYLHIAVDGENGKRVVVSALRYPVKNIFSNFSFLFLVLVLCIVSFIIIYTIRYSSSKINTSFATKIQVYLNLAFFLPLFVVSVATLSIINSAYKNNLSRLFIRNAENVSNNIRAQMDNYNKERISREALASELTQIARHTGSDVNMFDANGLLTATSQPLIYEDGLLSRYINPEAYIEIARMNNRRVKLEESVGKLHYSSVYVGVKSYDKNQLLGIISIPFFESKAELDRQMIEVLSTIMNIFTAIFICFLVFSYFASRILTVPLRLITQKIQKTTLHDFNEPLEWESDDEIGLLVNEYNRMLVKLEENKQALSRSEKESAWREMAQQVAHEIKNPLTPMKLTLQHLQRTFKQGDELARKYAERSFNTLLEQVDTLSDIATSFSAFAKMPVPKEENFEISSVLRQTIDLYTKDADVELETAIPEGEFYVKGDQQLMSRIFANLILNGIQSVPANRVPSIFVSLQKVDNFIHIQIKDNGVGVAENIKHKIFIPNFSTKYAGSGIGLAVAKRGVEHAGGTIWFESEEGEGTAFFIRLPIW